MGAGVKEKRRIPSKPFKKKEEPKVNGSEKKKRRRKSGQAEQEDEGTSHQSSSIAHMVFGLNAAAFILRFSLY
jgi:hypothetical protein